MPRCASWNGASCAGASTREGTEMQAPKIRIEGVCKTFDNAQVVLDRVNLDIEVDTLTCLLGPSGCGKSTLLSMVAGFVQPSRGRIVVDGVEVVKPSADRGIVFQDYAL